MSAPGPEDPVAATEPVRVNGVEVRLEGLHYCGTRGSFDEWIVNRSYVSGGALVFTWGEQREHIYKASVRHLGSRCAELLNANDLPPSALLDYLAADVYDTASSAPRNIHRLLQGFYQCPQSDKSKCTEAGQALSRAVLALYFDHWRSRRLLPLPAAPVEAHGVSPPS